MTYHEKSNHYIVGHAIKTFYAITFQLCKTKTLFLNVATYLAFCENEHGSSSTAQMKKLLRCVGPSLIPVFTMHSFSVKNNNSDSANI